MRDGLFELYRERKADADEHVLRTPEDTLYRAWQRVVRRANVGLIRRKDLRDTFASQLLTAGIQLGYISKQLGHASLAVTEQHYALWIEHEGDAYRAPMRLHPGEVPADLLARLQKRPHGDPTWREDDFLVRQGVDAEAR